MAEEMIQDLVILQGPDEFVALGVEAIELIEFPLAELIGRPFRIDYVELLGHGAPAFAHGYCRTKARGAEIRTLRRPDGSPRAGLLRYHTIHELCHQVDADSLDGKRRRVRTLIRPYPASWGDVDGLSGMARYWRLPSETFANRMVEALTDHRIRSTFDDDYTRTIADAELPKLLQIVIEGEPDGADAEPMVEPQAEPAPDPDACRQLQTRVMALEFGIRSASQALADAVNQTP